MTGFLFWGEVGSCSCWGDYLPWKQVLPGGAVDRRKLCQIFITRGEFPAQKVFNKKLRGVCGNVFAEYNVRVVERLSIKTITYKIFL